MKERRWYYLLPIAGTLFGIWYIHIAFYDVVYSDYIRLVNSYLPNVWDLSLFLVPDVLTRIPLNYLGRIVNTTFFHYSVTFDQILGVLGMGLSGAVLAAYCIRRNVGAAWTCVLMAVVFSLAKWEMLTNGSGWVHFFAFAGFYYHYLVLDRVWSGEEKPHDRQKLLWLPSLLILGVAGPYCAVYAGVLFLTYLFRIAQEKRSARQTARRREQQPVSGQERQREQQPVSGQERQWEQQPVSRQGRQREQQPVLGQERQSEQQPVLRQECQLEQQPVLWQERQWEQQPVSRQGRQREQQPVLGQERQREQQPVSKQERQSEQRPVCRPEKSLCREYLGYLAAVAVPFACYLVSNSFAVEDHAGMHDVSLIAQLLDTPLYFVRFLLKSLASVVAGGEYARAHFTSEVPYVVLGLLVAAAYLAALWFQYRYRIYKRTILPLILILSGGANHLLVLLSRWSFLVEDYGMSSRYSLQFAAGVLGIVLTCAEVWRLEKNKNVWTGSAAVRDRRRRSRSFASRCTAVFLTAMFLTGTVGDTVQELKTAPYRKLLCIARAEIALDFENRSDDELRENFEYRTSQPESGQAVRSALTILKEQGWNVFYDGQERQADE